MKENIFCFCDVLTDKAMFEKWQASQYSTVDEAFFERRKQTLHCLVRKVIKNEICEKDRTILEMYWYKGLTQRKIASRLGLSRSYVNRSLKKSKEIIYQNLKYVMFVLYGLDFNKEI